ncbi:MAG: hypothetical protein HQL97_10070 [Magnetococcales bacterium]|nr:hypothetical protein [Magnetococcales bacterium]
MKWDRPWMRTRARWLILVGILVVIFAVVEGYRTPPPVEPTPEIKQAASRPAYEVGGPTLTEMRGDRVIRSFSAKEFTTRRRSFMAFQVKGIEEALFQDARLSIYRYTKDREKLPESLGDEVASLLKGVIGKPGSGEAGMLSALPRVMQLILEPVTLEILVDQSVVLRLHAHSARIGKDRQRIEFRQAELENPAKHQRITSSRIDWNESSRSFEIAESYRAESPLGHAVARGLRVGLDFAFSPL